MRLTRTQKILVGAGLAYLAVPIVRRLSNGCPAFGSKVETVVVGNDSRQIQTCGTLGLSGLLFWPLGYLYQK